jgi:peptide/nickel transport system ATP-binding protein
VFHPRCRYATDICTTQVPDWRIIGNDHWVACHRAEEIALAGAA